MAAVAVVAPLPVMRTPETWQYGDPSLADLRLSLLDRGQSDGVTRRKRTGSSRNRHSWRWSWKQMLTKPFQNQTWTRGGNLREKGNRKKRKSETQNVSKNPVETRKKMDELYRIWLCDDNESSEESSDEELSGRDRRRSCYPRLFSNDTSSSDSETDTEHQVSQYAREGPSRIKVDTIQQERINEDNGSISDTSSQSSDSSDSASDLIRTPKQGAINHAIDMNNPDKVDYGNILEQNQSVKKFRVIKIEKNQEQSCVVSQTPVELEVVEMKRNPQPHLSIVTHPITKTAHIKAIPEYSTSILQAYSRTQVDDSKEITDLSDAANHERQIITVSAQMTKENEEKAYNSSTNSNHVSHDNLTSSLNSAESQEQVERINPGAMTSTRAMINNYPNGHAISVRQIYHEDILKRVDELCAQCDTEVYGNDERKWDSYGTKNGEESESGTRRFTNEEGGQKNHSFDGYPCDLDTPQEGCKKISSDKPTKDVVPDYPSSYLKSRTQHQMSSQNEEQYLQQQCQFQRFGCYFSGTSTAVEEHVQSSLHEHLKLVSKLAQDQKEQLESQQLEQQKQSLLIQQLTDTVNNLEKLVREQNKATHSQEKTVHTLKDQIKDQRKQSQRFEREITNQIQALNQSPTSSLPTNLCVAEYVWPIKNFRRRLRRIQDGEIDDPLISEPFYTGVYGYKLSIWVYLNGRGKTLGDWVSVFARVMPSDHDNILSWPVRPMYTFTLLDQSEGEKDHIVRKRKVNDIKRDGGKHHGIHRPEGGERSVIVGFDDFVAHAQLEKRKFVVEDCIYLKLEANIMH